MGFQDDFLSFQIRGIAAGVSKLLGNKDASTTELVQDEIFKSALPKITDKLIPMIAVGEFEEVEQVLYALLADDTIRRKDVFSIAEWYFDRLIHLPDEALAKANYSVSDIAMKKLDFFSNEKKNLG